MATFRDLRQFVDPNLTLPIGGKEYVVPAPTAQKSLELRGWVLSGTMTDFDEVKAGAELCGGRWNEDTGKWTKPKASVFAELMADLDWYSVYRVLKTAVIHYGISPEHGIQFWETGAIFAGTDPAKSEN